MKNIAITLDLEADHGLRNQDNYESMGSLDDLIELLVKYSVPLTVFVTGKIIKEKSSLIEKFHKLKVEFGLHTYSHGTEEINKIDEVEKAYNAYKSYFKREPYGYRPAYGIISRSEIDYLSKKRTRYISTLTGRRVKKCANSLLDIPVSKLRLINIPLGLGWVNFFGIKMFKILLKLFSFNDPAVFYFHMHDLLRSNMIEKLPFYWKIFYYRNKRNNFIDNLQFVLEYFGEQGYRFVRMSEMQGVNSGFLS